MLTTSYGAGLLGIDGFVVTVECNSTRALPAFEMVGLPDAAVKESWQRVETAMYNTGIYGGDLSIKINLAPADMKKEGSALDLAIAVAILQGKKVIPPDADLSGMMFIGELSFSGAVRPVRGVLSMVICAKDHGMTTVFVPAANSAEASVVEGVTVYSVSSLADLIAHLSGRHPMSPTEHVTYDENSVFSSSLDFADVKGQEGVKRALEIAAAGGHNVLMIGPPGSGKSMMAKRLPSILPPMTFREALETTRIHSATGTLKDGSSLITERPFRAPHHNASAAALVGGGSKTLTAGEVSLAHNGVLFLDELPEFHKDVTESLRQPMEDGKVTVIRSGGRLTFPSSFMLVAAMNPCKCGFYGSNTKACTCKPTDIKKYLAKISGPLLDRIDIQVEVPALSFDELSVKREAESSAAIRERVAAAREIAKRRLEEDGISCNAAMTTKEIKKYCATDEKAKAVLRTAFDSMGMSGRGYDRILRVARTIADLDGEENISVRHVAEAVRLRTLDKKYF
ncbi:MAG: YifB family Mg chelatase-like AAA ATPase [Clostridia bacterium]|nr:YifB family Mg chelatase-like AAA ATPase [Clostridia bacterium]